MMKIALIFLLLSSQIAIGENIRKNKTQSAQEPNLVQGTHSFSLAKHALIPAADVMQGGQFALHGIIGQIDASSITTGTGFSNSGGYLHPNTDLIFKNNFE